MSDKAAPRAAIVMGTGATGIRMFTGTGAADATKDVVNITPAIKGPHGRGWTVNIEAMLARSGAHKGDDSSLGMWLIEAPWAHPIWHSYLLALIHLRPTPRGGAAKLYVPDATHEFFLWACNPEEPREPFIRGEDKSVFRLAMTPMNFAAQIRCPDDDAARRVMEHTIQEICDGVLSPDTDYTRMWRDRFGDSNIKPEFR